MIKLTLGDGTRIIVNPAAIAYMQSLPDIKSGDKEQPRTKVALMTGESFSVRQGAGQILVAAGFAPAGQKGAKEHEPGASEE